MPFDTPFLTADELLPENLNFPVEFEPTKVADKKYVINGNTGDYLGVVGNSFKCANHGDFFVGYLLDVAIDAESELVTAVNVLPGNGAEAADAAVLIRQEEAAQGNDVAEVSIDGIGYNAAADRRSWAHMQDFCHEIFTKQ